MLKQTVGAKKKCPHCESLNTESRGLKAKTILTVLGYAKFRRRSYRCHDCGRIFLSGWNPLDIGRGFISKGVVRRIASLAIQMPVRQVVRTYREFSPFNVSDFQVKRICNLVGGKLTKEMEAQITCAELETALEQRKKPAEVGYIMGDGAFVPVIGEKGREYTENKLGLIFTEDDLKRTIAKNGDERVEIERKRYAMHLGSGVSEFAENLSKVAIKAGATFAKKLVFLSDGAEYLKNICQKTFPSAIRILDWYHAVEHLHDAAKKIFGEENPDQCKSWLTPLKTLLWDGKVGEVLHALKSEAMSYKGDATPYWELIRYYSNHSNAMNYAKFRAEGFFIGSGPMESANSYLVANRMKLSGMSWSRHGAKAMLWLRAKFFEQTWDQFWEKITISEYLAPT